MLFQLSPQLHFGSIFPGGPVVGQNEVGMHAVENSELAHGIGHGLIWPDDLQDFKRKRRKSEEKEQNTKRRTSQRGNRGKDKSILRYSENRVYILLLIALWVASFMVNVPQSQQDYT